jgi:O-acetyl-ADP-ribose deacetylase (regulator of RNase III)
MTDVLTERGDITRAATDAIVNAANEALAGGGGVDGAIHPAKYVIHTVGPRYSMDRAAELLESAFVSSLTIASDHDDIRTVALPAISCGIYGYPVDEAAAIARLAVVDRTYDLDEIRFVLFSDDAHRAFGRALGR